MIVVKKVFEQYKEANDARLEQTIGTVNATASLVAQQENNIASISSHVNALNEKMAGMEKELKEYLDMKKRKESEEPYIQIISQSFDDTNGLQMELDWNDAMINYLKRNGYRGLDDEDIIMKYVSDLFNEKVKNGPESIV